MAKRKFAAKSAGKIAVLAMLFALEVVFICVPVSVSGVSLAMCIVPVLIAALVQSFGITMILTLIMALGLWASAFVSASPFAAIFRNPLVGIFPRIAVGAVAYGIYHGLLKLAGKKLSLLDSVKAGQPDYKVSKAKSAAMKTGFSMAACMLGTLTNTALVSLMIWLCYVVGDMKIDSNLPVAFFEGAVIVNAVIEAVAFTLIVPPIAAAVSKAGYTIKGKKRRAVKGGDVDSNTVESTEKEEITEE